MEVHFQVEDLHGEWSTVSKLDGVCPDWAVVGKPLDEGEVDRMIASAQAWERLPDNTPDKRDWVTADNWVKALCQLEWFLQDLGHPVRIFQT